jgi:hypothetical protein
MLLSLRQDKAGMVGGPAGRNSSAEALLSRRHSGFCGLNRLDESTKADHYSRKLYQASRIEIL